MKKHFTLIELLIIVAIIAILISLLLPALTNAKNVTKRSLCLSNHNQTSTAAFLYLKNNSYKFPDVNINHKDASFGGRSWFGKKGRGDWLLTITQRPMNKYLGLTEDGIEPYALICPFNDLTFDDVYTKVGTSYIGNSITQWESLSSKFLPEVTKPSTTVMISEFGSLAYARQYNHPDVNFWRMVHHIGVPRYPFARIDGSALHAKILPFEGINFESEKVNMKINF